MSAPPLARPRLPRLDPGEAVTRLRTGAGAARTRAAALGRRGPFTDLGASVLVLAVASLIVGVWQGWVELVALGVLLGVVLVAALAWTLRRVAFVARIDLAAHRMRIGEELLGRIVVRNTGARLAVPDRIELPVGAARGRYPLPVLGRGEEHEQGFSVPGRRRGVIIVGPVRSLRGDPLGLLRATQRWTGPETIWVHPRVVPVDLGTAGLLRDIDGIPTADLTTSDVSFHALREYEPGDDRRAVHWLTTARTGRLMIRQFEEARRSHLLLIVSLRESDYASPEDFETAVSVVASCGAMALAQGRQVSVVAGRRLLVTPTAPLLLDRLAELTLDPDEAALPDVATAAAVHAPAASAAVIAAGSNVSSADLAAADARLPLGITASALLAHAGAPLRRRSVGRVVVIDVPRLDDLPRVLRGL